jgi:hypothetical protein
LAAGFIVRILIVLGQREITGLADVDSDQARGAGDVVEGDL